MRLRLRLVQFAQFVLLAGAFLFFCTAWAQSPAAHITLGQSAVPLYGPWKFTVGDSPIDPKTGKPLWAEPDFDDSQWEKVDLAPEGGTKGPASEYLHYEALGWTAKGHPGYWGYAWYRIRVQVLTQPGQARPSEELALAGPNNVDDVYQVFNNGELAGQFGDFTGRQPAVYGTLPKMFLLSQPTSRGAGNATLGTPPDASTRVLAFRVWMPSFELRDNPTAGGFHSAPVLGETGAIAGLHQMRQLELIRLYARYPIRILLFCPLSVVAFTLILFDRSDRVYLWIGTYLALIAFHSCCFVLAHVTGSMSIPVSVLIMNLVSPLSSASLVMVWRGWFGQRRPSWLPLFVAVLTLLLMASNTLGDYAFYTLAPNAFAHDFVTVSMVLEKLIFFPIFWVVVEGIRRQGVEGWLVLPVAVMQMIIAIGSYLHIWQILHFPQAIFLFGVNVTPSDLLYLLNPLVIALLLLRRLLKSVKRQRLMALDVKQAQEVQQVILPEARLVIPGLKGLPGLTIESEYRPAREVGGDFFQIIPHKSDGSVLIVAGDVTGKGLQAGMLVALLVGAIRTEEKHGNDPVAILSALNERLMGRGDAQATCLALRISSDGGVMLANAGHVAPYLNGEELPMEGALPLGMIEGAEPSVMRFALKQGDRLVLMSDGIAEATDANGKLFGFERVHALLRKSPSATEVANAAQAFGQEDDISVISVTRMEAATAAMAS